MLVHDTDLPLLWAPLASAIGTGISLLPLCQHGGRLHWIQASLDDLPVVAWVTSQEDRFLRGVLKAMDRFGEASMMQQSAAEAQWEVDDAAAPLAATLRSTYDKLGQPVQCVEDNSSLSGIWVCSMHRHGRTVMPVSTALVVRTRGGGAAATAGAGAGVGAGAGAGAGADSAAMVVSTATTPAEPRSQGSSTTRHHARRALCVGISEYSPSLGDSLPRAPLHANRVAGCLQRIGYKVTTLPHDTQPEQLRKQVVALADDVQPGDVIVVYINSHGLNIHGHLVIVGPGSRHSGSRPQASDFITIETLHAEFEERCRTRLRGTHQCTLVFMADCCRFYVPASLANLCECPPPPPLAVAQAAVASRAHHPPTHSHTHHSRQPA